MKSFKNLCEQLNPVNGKFVTEPVFETELMKTKVLKYMEKWHDKSIVASMVVYDNIANEVTDFPMRTYNDGEYFWTSREIYYFDKYNLKLNDAFVKKAITSK